MSSLVFAFVYLPALLLTRLILVLCVDIEFEGSSFMSIEIPAGYDEERGSLPRIVVRLISKSKRLLTVPDRNINIQTVTTLSHRNFEENKVY